MELHSPVSTDWNWTGNDSTFSNSSSSNPFSSWLSVNISNDLNPTVEDLNNLPCVKQNKFYIYSILAGFLCTTGIVSNAFSIAVLRRDRETTPTASLLLRSLAAADIFYLSSWIIPAVIHSAIEFFTETNSFHTIYQYLRFYSHLFIFVGQTMTIWTTVLISGTRFISVCLPYYAPIFCTLRATRIRFIVIVIFSFIYNVPRFFEFRIIHIQNSKVIPYEMTSLAVNSSYQLYYQDISYYVFMFVLPLILLTTFNIRLIVDYRRINRKRNSMMSRGRTSAREKQEQNITLIMIIIIVIFVVCNIPAKIVQLMTRYTNQRCPGGWFYLHMFSDIFEILNSTLNFFVYFIFRKQFRLIIQRELCARNNGSTTANTVPPCPSQKNDTQLQETRYRSIAD